MIALNLSNNAFTGHIPLSLANVTELQSLDLSEKPTLGDYSKRTQDLQGTQITRQPESSFEGNAGLCGFPLKKSCFVINVPPTQQPKEEEDERGGGRGTSFELEGSRYRVWTRTVAIAQVIAFYKPKCFVNIVGSDEPR